MQQHFISFHLFVLCSVVFRKKTSENKTFATEPTKCWNSISQMSSEKRQRQHTTEHRQPHKWNKTNKTSEQYLLPLLLLFLFILFWFACISLRMFFSLLFIQHFLVHFFRVCRKLVTFILRRLSVIVFVQWPKNRHTKQTHFYSFNFQYAWEQQHGATFFFGFYKSLRNIPFVYYWFHSMNGQRKRWREWMRNDPDSKSQ